MRANRFSRPRARPVAGTMNKLEQDYSLFLSVKQKAGEIQEFKFEAIKLRLASKTFYTPDFVVITDEGIELHEVKGFWEDDARVKIKVAAEQFWWFRFRAVTRPSKSVGFVFEEFS
jgi:hypothetical protein